MISRPKLHLPVQALVCVAAFGFGLPLAIALFPQTSEVRTNVLSDVLVCNIAEYFFQRVVLYLDEPLEQVKIQTTNNREYYTPKMSNELFTIQLLLFSAKYFCSFLIRR